MKIRLLPSNVSTPRIHQSLTSFLIDDAIAVDSGSLGLVSSPANLMHIQNVIITHTHIDHIASLPVFISEAFYMLHEPINVYATRDSIECLRKHIFNNLIWPDFERIRLLNRKGNSLRFVEIEPEKPFKVKNIQFTAVPTNHTVPTIGLAIETEDACVILTSDTYVTDEVWEMANRLTNLQAMFVDVSYPNEMSALAENSKHLTPEKLKEELRKLKRKLPVFAIHLKPNYTEKVAQQLKELGQSNIYIGEIDRDYTFPLA